MAALRVGRVSQALARYSTCSRVLYFRQHRGAGCHVGPVSHNVGSIMPSTRMQSLWGRHECDARGFTSTPSPSGKGADARVTFDSLNGNLKQAEYAVRGTIVLRAMELDERLRKDAGSLPFEKITFCNIGNPQALDQQPLSFNRQVLALLEYPALLDNPHVNTIFPEDVIARAKQLIAGIPGGIGAYSESQGIRCVRESVAKFIEERDGFPSDPANIFITDGASPAVQMLIRACTRSQDDAFMIPIPQYPLYSASIALYGGTQIGYELDESKSWSMPVATLRSLLAEHRAKGKNVRGLAVINPGNPTGNCLPKDNIREIVEFCAEENILIMADEVYQNNIWQGEVPFTSFKQVASEMGVLSGDSPLQLASFHSVSKGYLGECGKRGGYVELVGFEDAVKDQLYKLVSISLCSNISGQAMVELMVNPPKPGDASYDTFVAERDAILASLQRRAEKLVAALNNLEGVTCNRAQGALYAFPSVSIPQRAIDEAANAHQSPDLFYCLQLLEATGIVFVPGSGFGQKENTYHFRTTILPPEHDIDRVIDTLGRFHADFMSKYQ